MMLVDAQKHEGSGREGQRETRRTGTRVRTTSFLSRLIPRWDSKKYINTKIIK